jgi:hypothetical protein
MDSYSFQISWSSLSLLTIEVLLVCAGCRVCVCVQLSGAVARTSHLDNNQRRQLHGRYESQAEASKQNSGDNLVGEVERGHHEVVPARAVRVRCSTGGILRGQVGSWHIRGMSSRSHRADIQVATE